MLANVGGHPQDDWPILALQHVSLIFQFANVLLAKAGHMAKQRIRVSMHYNGI